MRKEIVVPNDYSSEFNLDKVRLVIPEPKFSEVRLPRLSDSTSLDEQVLDSIKNLAHVQAHYDPEAQKNPFPGSHSFIYIVGNDMEARNTVAGSVLNFLSDLVDYRNAVNKGVSLDLHVLYLDAHQTLAEEIPTDVLDDQGRVQKLVPLEYPEAQRVNYLKKVQTAEKAMREPGRLYAMVLPDIDEIISNGLNQGWTSIGRQILSTFEHLERDNCLVIGTLKPDVQILYGNQRQAGLNKTYNLVVDVQEK
jgi:hypothetical protein